MPEKIHTLLLIRYTEIEPECYTAALFSLDPVLVKAKVSPYVGLGTYLAEKTYAEADRIMREHEWMIGRMDAVNEALDVVAASLGGSWQEIDAAVVDV